MIGIWLFLKKVPAKLWAALGVVAAIAIALWRAYTAGQEDERLDNLVRDSIEREEARNQLELAEDAADDVRDAAREQEAETVREALEERAQALEGEPNADEAARFREEAARMLEEAGR